MSLVVVDACGANISSVLSALNRLGADPVVSADANTIAQATRVILPGAGAAGSAMQRLRDAKLNQLIPTLTQPVLGICVGMQVLFESSEEDDCECLGVFPARLKRLPSNEQFPVPHMGWNQLKLNGENAASGDQPLNPLLANLGTEAWCYFVHSYAAPVIEETIASCNYSSPFTAAVTRGNFSGVQFHPERSGDTGEKVLENFSSLVPSKPCHRLHQHRIQYLHRYCPSCYYWRLHHRLRARKVATACLEYRACLHLHLIQ